MFFDIYTFLESRSWRQN